MGAEANLPFVRQWLEGASDGVLIVEGGRIGGFSGKERARRLLEQ